MNIQEGFLFENLPFLASGNYKAVDNFHEIRYTGFNKVLKSGEKSMSYSIRNIRPVILFDLDGTLLPMDIELFEKGYFKGLCEAITELSSKEVIASVWEGVKAMVKNDGSVTNREAFAKAFTEAAGMDYYENEERFLEYYRVGFQECAKVCGITDVSRKIVETLQKKGYTVAIATNPIFPEIATYSRLRWLGIDPESLSLVTTFDNSHTAKPNPAYYQEVCDKLGVKPEDCIMIGNDVEEDGCAATLGIEVKLVTDCLLNTKKLPMDSFEQGSLEDVLVWAENLPEMEGQQ